MNVATTFAQCQFADLYERVLVPGIFHRYARDLVERARPIGPSDRILDLGCGTGIVARTLRERLGAAASIRGVDMSPAMIAKASSLDPTIEFKEANASSLPFADGSFEVVLSQQMIQFVPDRAAVLREIQRVLAPGGRFLASTWRPRNEQPFYEALGVVAERHLPPGKDPRFTLDGETLRRALVELGFTDVRIDRVTFTDHLKEFPVRQSAMVTSDTSSLSDEERDRRLDAIEAESKEVLARFALDGGFAAPSFADVVTARKA